MKALEINERFAQYFDALDYGQEQQLARSLQDDLTSEPVLWWHNKEKDRDELIDGHHRYKIAKRLKIELQTHEKHFDSEDEALIFIIRNQTTRRNLDERVRANLIKEALKIYDAVTGATKRDTVAKVAVLTGVSERTIWRTDAEDKPKNPVEVFKESKADLERKLASAKTKAVEQFKVQAVKEQLDEDTARERWQELESEIDKEYEDEILKVESLGDAAQQAIEESPGLRNSGKKRPPKKSTKDRAARRNTFKKALSLIGRLKNEAFYFWVQSGCGDVDISELQAILTKVAVQIGNAQDADAKAAKKRKFGGK